MLSVSGLSPARADYYVEQVAAGLDEYYTGDQAEPGRWAGTAAERLGLQGLVTARSVPALARRGAPGHGRAARCTEDDVGARSGASTCVSAPPSP